MKLDHDKILKNLIELHKKGEELDNQLQATRYQIHDLLWVIAKARKAELTKQPQKNTA